MDNSIHSKKSKLSKLEHTLHPLESVTHQEIRNLLDQTETVELKIPAGCGISVFEITNLKL